MRSGGKRGDFIENNGAIAAHFEAAKFALHRARESAALMAKELAFDKLRRKAGAIDFQERSVAAWTKFMDQARKVILAAAALARDQERSGSDRDFLREFKKTL